MIHTFQIQHQIPEDSTRKMLSLAREYMKLPYEKAVHQLTGRLIKDKNQQHRGTYLDDINKMIPLKEYDCATKSVKINPAFFGLGFNGITLMRICIQKGKTKKKGIEYGAVECQFYLKLEINPRTLCNPLHTFTIDLYEASTENNRRLKTMFYSIMTNTLCKYDNSMAYLCDLQSWNCNRIDYTLNMKFPTVEEKRLFWELTHKTSAYNRTQRKRMKDVKMMEQSAAEGNQSYKTLFYDKQDECTHTYKNISDENLLPLLLQADNVIRMEHQVRKDGIASIKNRYHFPDRSIMHFLSEEIASKELLNRYDKMVGTGDFYHREEAKRIIRKKIKSEAMQERLIQLLALLAQKRHLDKAREYFTCPNHPEQQRNFPSAHGTTKTFNDRITKLRELGINPMLITDGCNVRFMKNPRYLLA